MVEDPCDGVAETPDRRLDAKVDVRRALMTLGDDERRVVYLHYWCDLTCVQVAARLGLPVGTVKVRLFRGRARLLLQLTET